MPILRAFGDVQVTDMFISVDRMEYGQTPGKSAVMEVAEAFGIQVHALVNADDIRAWLVQSGSDPAHIRAMDAYREMYCVQ